METLKTTNKVCLAGKIITVNNPVQVGQNNLDKQVILFEKPPYNDGYETKGEAEMWELSIIGSKVKELNVQKATHEGKFAKVVFYVNSKAIASRTTGEVMHIVNCTLAQIELK